MDSGAIFDKSRKYRYLLWREWNPTAPSVCFVMLNPSTADAQRNDPTITRCLNFARGWGFGRMEVVNLFSYRATESGALYTIGSPIGTKTDEYIIEHAAAADTVVVAWGNHGRLMDRCSEVSALLHSVSKPACFGLTDLYQPKHPLYLRSDSELVPFS